VDDDRVYISGAMGAFFCFDVKTGEVRWKKDFLVEYSAPREKWHGSYGFVAPALVDGDKVIVKVGGEPNAKVVAFDKRTGKEIWRALSSAESGPAYSPLVIVKPGRAPRQLIVWHDSAVASLDPDTGKVHWEYPWSRTSSLAVPAPLQAGSLLFFSGYYGARVLKLDEEKPAPPEELWRSMSESETVTDTMNALMMTPIIIGDYVYGIDSHGELRCLDLKTGERIWETQAVTRDRALHATAHIVRNGDRVFIVNDFGEMIIARLDPKGYHEISRTQLIEPTAPNSQRRSRPKGIWTPPAFANKHVIIRNDEEILSVNLAGSS
jgi:outer membrane protein assembly factor BamB